MESFNANIIRRNVDHYLFFVLRGNFYTPEVFLVDQMFRYRRKLISLGCDNEIKT